MNGYEIYNKAVQRLGYNEFLKSGTDEILLKKAKELINQTAMDLKLHTAVSLNEETEYGKQETEALICGVAMLFSLSEGDTEKSRIYTDVYNAKRAALLSKTDSKEDVLPNVGNGGF